MSTKTDLIKKLQPEWQKYWKVALFEQEGFRRHQCTKCQKFFWSLVERKTCGDSSCDPYTFIGNSPASKSMDYVETWKAVEKFFEKNGHKSVERYPTIARWRPDLFFNIASITSFQRVENGKIIFDFPHNPLIIPQNCLRFNDIPNVGVTGRHFTNFVMIGQHATYDPKKPNEGYWKDEAIRLDWKMLTEVLGIPKEEITFIEDVWVGYGAFGYSLEYFVRGLELGNCVFTEFEGNLQDYKVMDQKVVDMGAGLERFSWMTQGTPTAYDATFGEVMEKLKKMAGVQYDKDLFLRYAKLAGGLNADEVDVNKELLKVAQILKTDPQELREKILPMQALYAIADHTKTLLFTTTDGQLPSNVGGGHNLRVILRRALSMMDRHNFDFDISKMYELHAQHLRKMNPELSGMLDEVVEITEFEKRKYKDTMHKAKVTINTLVEKKITIDEKRLMELYESQGITPELIKEVAEKHGISVEVPADFYVKVTEKNIAQKMDVQKAKYDVSGLPPTRKRFYEKPLEHSFEAKVIKIFDSAIVLDHTLFYPTSGGQMHDMGTINGMEVTNVEKIGDTIVHHIKGRIREGEKIHGVVDWARRTQLNQHHTAAHVIGGAARIVLGKHIWQAGTEKDVDKGRLDITHYENLTPEQIDAIEEKARDIVKANVKLNKRFWPRREAEQRYGFGLYQGGYVPGNEIRVVEIPGYDVQACGGIHVEQSGDIGHLAITGTERLQDGVVRITFVGGNSAEKYLTRVKQMIDEVQKTAGVPRQNVPNATATLFEKWKESRKELEKFQEEFASAAAESLSKKFEIIHNKKVLLQQVHGATMEELRKIAASLEQKDALVFLIGTSDKVYVSAVGNITDVGKLVRESCKMLGGGGGGNENRGEGVGKDSSKISAVIEYVKGALK